MSSRIILKQTLRSLNTTTSAKTNIINKNIRIPSVKINTTVSHELTNDIKSLQQSNKRRSSGSSSKNYIPSLSSDNDTLETASSYLRV